MIRYQESLPATKQQRELWILSVTEDAETITEFDSFRSCNSEDAPDM